MTKKRIVCLVTLICIMTAMLAGCGKDAKTGAGTDTTLKVVVTPKNKPDSALVSQELSKITREKIGADVEFMFGYDEQKLTLMLASNEEMDIGSDGGLGYVTRIDQGAYLDITDMVKEKTPKLYKTIPEEIWEGTKIGGKNYAVPTLKEMAEVWTAYIDKRIMDESGVDPKDIKELKDLEPVLATLKKYPERAGLEILTVSINHLSAVIRSKYDVVYGYYVVDRKNPGKIVHFMETQDYKDFVHLMRDWYKKGYIAQDVATKTDYYVAQRNSGNMGVKITWSYPTGEISSAVSYNVDEIVPINLTPAIKSNDSMLGNLYGVYSKSKNVDTALKFLELWNTEPEVKNLITYGIEGKHYDMVDGKVRRRDGAFDLYRLDNAISGNMMISYLLEGDPDNKWELFREFNDSAIESNALGFFPDDDKFSAKYSACSNVLSEYNPLLCCGVVEPDEYLAKMLKDLKKAGTDDVKAELQKQYSAWRKNK